MSDAYSVKLRRLAFLAAHDLSLPEDALEEGVYTWVSGPTYETPAEGRFLRAAGGDVVGMSTVPEVLAAREEGMEVMVLSLVTNAVEMPEDARKIKAEVKAEVSHGSRFNSGTPRSPIAVACWKANQSTTTKDGQPRRGAFCRESKSGSDEEACCSDYRAVTPVMSISSLGLVFLMCFSIFYR